MKTAAKVLRFPLSGIARDTDFRKAYIPAEEAAFATPLAENVRGGGSFYRRNRGGSRPGLKKVVGQITKTETSRWMWVNGEPILWPNGANVAFKNTTSIITAPDGSKIVDPHAPVNCSALGITPTISTFYRNRAVCASGAQWYMSAIGDIADWDFGKDSADSARAVSGNVELAGLKGETITALMPIRDSFLYIATAHSIWCVNGDPTAGNIKCVSEYVGCVSANAWCFDGEYVWFVSNQGVYAMGVGAIPMKASTRIPDEFLGTKSALLVYDSEENGVHIFSTDANNANSDWFYEKDNKAFWKMSYPTTMRPTCASYMMMGGIGVLVFLGGDGYWRYFDNSQATDDGTTISSKVAIGPIRVSARDDMDGMVGEVMATIAEGSSDVSMSIYCAHSPEAAVDAAEDGTTVFSPVTIKAGWNNTVRPRQRGAWAVFVLSSTGRWAYESMTAVMKILGRLR